MPDEERKFRKQHMISDQPLLTYGIIFMFMVLKLSVHDCSQALSFGRFYSTSNFSRDYRVSDWNTGTSSCIKVPHSSRTLETLVCLYGQY